jgi:hypothetical protein
MAGGGKIVSRQRPAAALLSRRGRPLRLRGCHSALHAQYPPPRKPWPVVGAATLLREFIDNLDAGMRCYHHADLNTAAPPSSASNVGPAWSAGV